MFIHEDQIRHPDVTEVHAEGVDPEMVGTLGVAGGDMTRDALVEPELGEEPETGGEPLLAVEPLLLDCGERRGLAQRAKVRGLLAHAERLLPPPRRRPGAG